MNPLSRHLAKVNAAMAASACLLVTGSALAGITALEHFNAATAGRLVGQGSSDSGWSAVWAAGASGTVTADTGRAAKLADSNPDGESNLPEFTSPHSLAAMTGGVSFIVEWSDTLAAGSWSSAGVNEHPAIRPIANQSVAKNGATQVAFAVPTPFDPHTLHMQQLFVPHQEAILPIASE